MRVFLGPHYGRPSFALDHSDSIDCLSLAALFNHARVRSAEIPSANGHASARGLASIASIMAQHGKARGTVFLSPQTVIDVTSTTDAATGLSGRGCVRHDTVLRAVTKLTRVGWGVFDSSFAYNRQGSLGWIGIGGSAMQWLPTLGIGFGYTCTLVGADLGNKHSAVLQNEIINCTRNKNKKL